MADITITLPRIGVKLLRDIIAEQPSEDEWTIEEVAEALMKLGAVNYSQCTSDAEREGRKLTLNQLLDAAAHMAADQAGVFHVLIIDLTGRDN